MYQALLPNPCNTREVFERLIMVYQFWHLEYFFVCDKNTSKPTQMESVQLCSCPVGIGV